MVGWLHSFSSLSTKTSGLSSLSFKDEILSWGHFFVLALSFLNAIQICLYVGKFTRGSDFAPLFRSLSTVLTSSVQRPLYPTVAIRYCSSDDGVCVRVGPF